MKIHQMALYKEPFEQIAKSSKTIELRLWDEKRQKLESGDCIEFTNLATNQKLLVEVLALHLFPSFSDLYQSLSLSACGYSEEELTQASSEDMETYYNKDQQALYGVVGIEIKLLSSSMN